MVKLTNSFIHGKLVSECLYPKQCRCRTITDPGVAMAMSMYEKISLSMVLMSISSSHLFFEY